MRLIPLLAASWYMSALGSGEKSKPSPPTDHCHKQKATLWNWDSKKEREREGGLGGILSSPDFSFSPCLVLGVRSLSYEFQLGFPARRQHKMGN